MRPQPEGKALTVRFLVSPGSQHTLSAFHNQPICVPFPSPQGSSLLSLGFTANHAGPCPAPHLFSDGVAEQEVEGGQPGDRQCSEARHAFPRQLLQVLEQSIPESLSPATQTQMSEGTWRRPCAHYPLGTARCPSSLPCLTPTQDVDLEGPPGSVPVLLPHSGALVPARVGLDTTHMPRLQHLGW